MCRSYVIKTNFMVYFELYYRSKYIVLLPKHKNTFIPPVVVRITNIVVVQEGGSIYDHMFEIQTFCC